MRQLVFRIVATLTLCAVARAEPPFDAQIAPLLRDHCAECHHGAEPEGGLNLLRRELALNGGDSGAVIVPGNAADSLLIQRVEANEMPPDRPLDQESRQLLRDWIDAGAQWGTDPIALRAIGGADWWSLQPVKRPLVPTGVTDDDNAIDAFISQSLQSSGLTRSPRADRVTLIRRLYLDVLGLPPTPEQVETFATDESSDAWSRLVDDVLTSPHFGERQARHWLDVVRFADSDGFETNHERPNAYHYRDYVIGAFNSDRPYDEFVADQLAGDARGQPAATGFLVGGPFDRVKGQDPLLGLVQRQDELTDIVNTTGTTFMGLSLGCARCHDHKFDPISQRDFYALSAVFAGVRHGEQTKPPALMPIETENLRTASARRDKVRAEIAALEPPRQTGAVVVIDDLDAERVTAVRPTAGRGENPAGAARGERNDPGQSGRMLNISGGGYSWWRNEPGAVVMSCQPGVAGDYRVWLSWGCGHTTHSSDATYLLDDDGDLTTTGDQHVIATVDQQRFADGTGEPVGRSLWSGLFDAGVHALSPTSILAMKCGETGSVVTSDVLVLQLDALTSPNPYLAPPVSSTRNEERFPPIPADFVRFTISAVNTGTEPCIDELEIYSTARPNEPAKNVAANPAAQATSSGDYSGNPKHTLPHVHDGRYGNDFSWISNTAGTGWVQIRLPSTTTIDRIVWQRDREGRYTDRLPMDYDISVATEVDGQPGAWHAVARGADRAPVGSPGGAQDYLHAAIQDENLAHKFAELSTLDRRIERLTAPVAMYAGQFEQPGTTHRLYRGDPLSPREEVAPAMPETFETSVTLPNNVPEQQRRLALAEWLVDPAHPLTARVMANRIWQSHFGRGLVVTPSDFGAMSRPPSHPELLDWLAAELVDSGWSLKQLHRSILLSQTYQQSSTPHSDGMTRDAGNVLLWRYPTRRLEAEAIRDSMLAVSGDLDPRMGGPGFLLFEPNANYSRNWVAKNEFGPAEARRMVYALKLRMEGDAVFGAFDCPDAGQIMPARPRSTTPIQALNLLNSPFVLDTADHLAGHARDSAGDDVATQVDWLFRRVFGRSATPREFAAASAVAGAHGTPALARALLNSNEFLFIP